MVDKDDFEEKLLEQLTEMFRKMEWIWTKNKFEHSWGNFVHSLKISDWMHRRLLVEMLISTSTYPS